MRKRPAKTRTRIGLAAKTTAPAAVGAEESSFREIVGLIQSARARTIQSVNTELIELYWRIGEVMRRRIAAEGWGKATGMSLAAFIRQREPNARGSSAQNLWRMRQFYETWRGAAKPSLLVR